MGNTADKEEKNDVNQEVQEESVDKEEKEDNLIKISREDLEELVEQKVDQRINKESSGDQQITGEQEEEETVSRRDFLKKIGAGAAGLGIMSLVPSASALDVRADDLRFYGDDSTQEFVVKEDGPVEVKNADLEVKGNTAIHGGNQGSFNVSSFSGNGGSSDQFLKTDGTSLNWADAPGVPSGVIVMWSGTTSDVPNGWTLCDGNNGTPDLRDRFVVGAGNSYSAGNTGGSDTVSLSTSELPSHDHGSGTISVNSHDHGDGTLDTSYDSADVSASASGHSHGGSTNQNGDHNHGYNDRGTSTAGGSDLATGSSAGIFTADSTTGSAGSHTHSISTNQSSANVSASADGHSHGVSGSTGYSSPGTSGSTSATGNGDAHENRPPYYALAYIMKE